MIPKVIHYCWFGGNPLPELAQLCFASWEKYCPDYKIVRWDETSFDIDCCPYVREAYEAKKWAFITDYVRLYAIVQYGGIYMDTDVEVCKPLDEFLKDEAFSGFETKDNVPTGIMAGEKGHRVFKILLDDYKDRHFKLSDGTFDMTTNTVIITRLFLQNGLVLDNKKQTIMGMTLYPNDFFCPKEYGTGIIKATNNTACIHHFNQSWASEEDRKYMEVIRCCNKKLGKFGIIPSKIYRFVLHPHNIIRSIQRFIKRNRKRS